MILRAVDDPLHITRPPHAMNVHSTVLVPFINEKFLIGWRALKEIRCVLNIFISNPHDKYKYAVWVSHPCVRVPMVYVCVLNTHFHQSNIFVFIFIFFGNYFWLIF